MKVITFFCVFIIFSAPLVAQSRQAFNYQAIARDYGGNALAEQSINLQASILLDGEVTVYVENHAVLTNQMGLFNIKVGYGEVQTGEFGNIDWANGTYFLQIEIDPEGGTNYQYLGIMQLLSVPFAFYANSTGGDADWNVSGDNMSSAQVGNVGIGTPDPGTKLDVVGALRSSWDITETDYLEMKHGVGNAYLKWGGIGNLDFRYDGNTLMSIYQDGRISLGADYAANSAILQLNSNTHGFRPPKMSAAKIAAIADPKNGLMVFNNTDEHLYVFRENEGGVWKRLMYDDDNIEPWECGDVLIDLRDQQTYETVQIGDQCWMAENLNIGERIDGYEDMTDNGTIEKYCYSNVPANCGTYGGLYQWNEMMQYTTTAGVQGICPTGWHLPADDEWKILEGNADSHYPVGDPEWDTTGYRGFDVGLNLKSTSGWNSNGNGTDLYGFGALPGGYRNHFGSFTNLGYFGLWWSSSEGSQTGAWARYLYYAIDGSWRDLGGKTHGFSVRCLKNITNQPATYILNLEVEPPEAGTASGAGQYIAEQPVNVVAEAHPGWVFVNWTDDDGVVGETANFSYIMPANDITLTANFSEEQVVFSCGDIYTDDRDGQQYQTVQIGDQCWMAENLNIGERIDGEYNQTDNQQIEKYCYNNEEATCDEYGGLYQWDEMMEYLPWEGVQGICPDGWHLPTVSDWCIMEQFVDPTIACDFGWQGVDGGGKLKEEGTSHWLAPNTGATNFFEFTALPGGFRHPDGSFKYQNSHGYWWISTEFSNTISGVRELYYDNAQINNTQANKLNGLSVRCIKDE